ncbi:MAG: pantoate--beta-alanine ligase [Acidimicrobiales bacterium]
MEQFATPSTMRAWSLGQRRAGHRVAVVPTMGALHDGHLHLVDVAGRHADRVIVTIFVNPLQFNRPDDLAAYPRTLDDDLAGCAAAGAHAVYLPTAAAMYPAGFETRVVPGSLAEPMEGAGRPGHFEGVTTVVTKLFNATAPDVAIFGQKDAQQLAIVRRMALDLDTGIEIVGVPTVRESDGLACSSRNRRLTPADRAAAVAVPRALAAAAAAIAAGERRTAAVQAAAEAVLTAETRARIEYVTVSDPATLRPVERIVAEALLCVAVWFGDVRLIDNALLAASA